MEIESALGQVNRVMSKLSRAWIYWVSLLGVGVIGFLDYAVGYEISLSVFYLCPVGIASWYAGGRSGALIAVISTFSALAGGFSEGHLLARPGIILWNGFLNIGFMLVVVYLLGRLHVNIKNEREIARSDPVTGLFNARAFLEQLEYHLALAAREGEPISLAYLDLDDFKRINDEGGHSEGDRVLRLVADTLMASVRRTDLVARVGGDEFVLLIMDADQNAAEIMIAKLKHLLQTTFNTERAMITCSIGCVTFQGQPPSADDALRSADLLMYTVKSQGKNAVAFEVFDPHKGKPRLEDNIL